MTHLLNGLLIKLFCFSPDFDETWWNCSTHRVLQFYQVASKSDEKQKSLLIAHFSVHNFKVSVELWESYIVPNSVTLFGKRSKKRSTKTSQSFFFQRSSSSYSKLIVAGQTNHHRATKNDILLLHFGTSHWSSGHTTRLEKPHTSK